MDQENPQIRLLAQRATSLYSLPAVALEMLELARDPDIDAAALKACLERDPALAAKVLRVVNSSLFGLSHPVGDLNQALAYLGVKPLKLLVLGFSLPDGLFAKVAADQLQWYWTNTLTRAVAARQLSELVWHQPGDEAFIAGLLQDLGVLALLSELGEPYARLLSKVIEENADLARSEEAVLGFSHVALSARLLANWNLPAHLVDAIAMPKVPARLVRSDDPDTTLAKILHLADLLAQLVGSRRLSVLPDLMESGLAYRQLTKERLHEVVEDLQQHVDDLADVLSLELPEDRDYQQILLDARNQLSLLAEEETSAAAQAASTDDSCDALWQESLDLTTAMQAFLREAGSAPPNANTKADQSVQKKHWPEQHGAHERTKGEQLSAATTTAPATCSHQIAAIVRAAARGCRMRKESLSLLLIEIPNFDELSAKRGRPTAQQCTAAVQAILCAEQDHPAALARISNERWALVLPGCERREAVEQANRVIDAIDRLARQPTTQLALADLKISAGAATVEQLPRNFESNKLIESAERCLSAARLAGGSSVKSIELY